MLLIVKNLGDYGKRSPPENSCLSVRATAQTNACLLLRAIAHILIYFMKAIAFMIFGNSL
ncbi:hypothetical protein H6G36_19955 [Anabaena minutissima FACHB-250]|nr:hypothetical protein [Anabaena minutissima FACHB-250]